jgi:hypothetical protein
MEITSPYLCVCRAQFTLPFNEQKKAQSCPRRRRRIEREMGRECTKVGAATTQRNAAHLLAPRRAGSAAVLYRFGNGWEGVWTFCVCVCMCVCVHFCIWGNVSFAQNFRLRASSFPPICFFPYGSCSSCTIFLSPHLLQTKQNPHLLFFFFFAFYPRSCAFVSLRLDDDRPSKLVVDLSSSRPAASFLRTPFLTHTSMKSHAFDVTKGISPFFDLLIFWKEDSHHHGPHDEWRGLGEKALEVTCPPHSTAR